MARIVRSPPQAPPVAEPADGAAALGPPPPDMPRPPRRWRDPALAVPALLALALWLAVSLPLAAGERTLFFRDVFGNHLPLKWFGAQALAAGEVPAVHPGLGQGQPFRGNPSALAFYPGNVLYLVLPFWSAFNLHYALHWLLAALAMVALARELGQGRAAALFAGVTYGGSGFLLSCLTFYNLVTVAAWWPLAIAGAARGGRRGIALGGVACGLALLGGEPLAAALGTVPLALAAVERHGSLRGLGTAAAVGGLGAAIALPQVVATARIVGFSFRGDHGALLSQVLLFTVPPERFLELVLPLPFGWPLDLGPRGWWAWQMGPNLGYFLSLYAGIVGLWLAVAAARRRPVWAALAAAGLLFAWLWGAAGEALAALTFGVFRYPERFVVWYGLALPLLAGWGLEAALARPGRRPRAALWAAGVFAAAAAALTLARPSLVAGAPAGTGGGQVPLAALVAAQTALWAVALAAAAALLGAAALALRRRRAGVLVVLQVLALAQLFPLVRTAPTAPFRRPPEWLAHLPPEPSVFHSLKPRPLWEPPPPRRFPDGSRAAMAVQGARELEAVPGVLHGVDYPLWPDMEGLSTPLHAFLTVRLATMGWPERAAWLRALGVDGAVFHRRFALPGAEPVASAESHGATALLYRVRDPAPDAWWPERLVPVPGPEAALGAVPALADPVREVVVARTVEHRPGGRVTLVEERPDRVVVDVAGEGGLVVVRRAYHTLYRARAGGRELDIQPVQMTLTGIAVPPGEHRVVLEVDGRPEAVALALSALAALAALALARRSPAATRGARGGDGARPADGPGAPTGGGANGPTGRGGAETGGVATGATGRGDAEAG